MSKYETGAIKQTKKTTGTTIHYTTQTATDQQPEADGIAHTELILLIANLIRPPGSIPDVG